jgi:hypothetical protein
MTQSEKRDRDGAHQRHLRRQIEYIRDTDNSEVKEVIVGMRTPQDDASFMQSIADVIRRRGLATSARDSLPVHEKVLTAKTKEGRPSASAARHLKEQDQSLAAGNAAASIVTEIGIAALRASGLGALQPLLRSEVVQDGIRNLVGGQKQKSKHEAAAPIPTTFWTSGCAVIRIPDSKLEDLTNIPDIEEIHVNRRLLLPPVVSPKQVPQAIEDNKVSAWGLRMTGALAAWGAYDRRGEGVTVGLLDTGVDAEHPDLKGKVAKWVEFDARGTAVSDSKPHDSDKHGTHCAGTIVGGKASGRWIGMAPNAKLAAALVLKGEEGGSDAQVLAGIQWAIEQQVDVISMSLGGIVWGPETPNTYTNAIRSALRVGIPVVAAIGNEGSQTSGAPGNDFLAFAVGATDYLNRAAGFSGGRTQIIRQSPYFPPKMLPLVYSKPDLSAPGVAIFSSVPKEKKWDVLNGTSMATPHVAGAIALLLSATKIKEKFSGAERAFVIQDLLTGSAEELGESGQNHRYGAGRLDILRAIGFAHDLGYAT